MSAYTTNTTWREIADRLRAARRLALVTHGRPDGDAIGSLLALARVLQTDARAVDLFLMGPIEPPLLAIVAGTPYRRVEDAPPGEDYDAIVLADTGAWSQVDPLQDWLRRHHERVIGIDHHAHGDQIAARRIVDAGAAAAAQMVVELIDELGADLGSGRGSAAEALFIGLATDTGWFRYANASPDAFRLAARLLDRGVDRPRLFRIIEENHRPQRLALEARALASISYVQGGQVAVQSLSPRDFQETGGSIEDLTGIVSRPMVVGQVRASILLAETEAGRTKISFRAKPATGAEPVIDVNRLARRLDGGGHVLAAGARLPSGLEAAHRTVLEAVEGYFREMPQAR